MIPLTATSPHSLPIQSFGRLRRDLECNHQIPIWYLADICRFIQLGAGPGIWASVNTRKFIQMWKFTVLREYPGVCADIIEINDKELRIMECSDELWAASQRNAADHVLSSIALRSRQHLSELATMLDAYQIMVRMIDPNCIYLQLDNRYQV